MRHRQPALCILVHSLPQLPVIVMPKHIRAYGWYALKIPTFPAFIPAVKAIFLRCIEAFGLNPMRKSFSKKIRLDLYENVIATITATPDWSMPVNAPVKCSALIIFMQVLAVTYALPFAATSHSRQSGRSATFVLMIVYKVRHCSQLSTVTQVILY